MLQLIKKRLSSIAVKLFLSFWLITLLSITITRFISNQLEQESIIAPIHHGDLRQLHYASQRLSTRPATNIKVLLNKLPTPHDIDFVIKDPKSQQVFLNRTRHLRGIKDYLNKNELTHQTTVQFPFVRLTGPELIILNNHSYQLFIAHKTRPPAIGSIIMQLPVWLRYCIPLVVSLLLCWLLARTLTKPLIAIKQAATDIGNGNYQVRVAHAVKRNDEIGEMANSFNQMAEKLDANISAHQRLLADVSHELRSPMTRLQMALGLIQQASTDNPTIDKHLNRCEQEVTQLDKLITNILSLSRLENSFQQLAFTRVMLNELLHKIVTDNDYLVSEKSIHIKLNCPEQLMLNANETLLYSALNNIVGNAIKYTHSQGTIDINATTNNDNIVITIADSGVGVPEQQLPLLFHPFYRVSDARDRDSGGTGLGLAIAKQAIELHHGQIRAENNHSGGLIITLELPTKLTN
ncbi:two-component sensor histidine kinase [Thalassotalea insulae]|uniref:histidine kinase n=1 Tax=Thalassotalea insulae TaxID=2056778 RepID=A0ABQ6GU22_9GAMM|nr:two-component sensor histidine kinase [Thalassotalea insulae]